MDVSESAEAAISIAGSYDFESADNVDEYLKGLGVGLVLRKVQSVAKPHYEIAQLPTTNQWKVMMESPFKKKEVVFRPFERFPDESFDSRPCHATVDVKENGRSMNWHQICEEGPDVETSMTATESGGFVMTMKSGEFKCEMKFRKSETEPKQAPAEERAVPMNASDDDDDEEEL